MRIAVTGATGAIGRSLVAVLREAGHEPVAFTRDATAARGVLPEGVEVREVDVYSSAALVQALTGCEGVVHLAGEPLFGKRWSKKQRKVIYDSRVVTTRALVQSLTRKQKWATVLVTHHADDISAIADRVYLLKNGVLMRGE